MKEIDFKNSSTWHLLIYITKWAMQDDIMWVGNLKIGQSKQLLKDENTKALVSRGSVGGPVTLDVL